MGMAVDGPTLLLESFSDDETDDSSFSEDTLSPTKCPLEEITGFVETIFDMFLGELCTLYGLDGKRFRNFLVRRVSMEKNEAFDPEAWIAKYCRFEALRRPGKICFFVLNDNDTYQGYLLKKGRINRAWKRRFFWLDGHFFQYAVDDTKTARGSIDLRESRVIEALHSDGTRRLNHGFALHSKSRILYLKSLDVWQQRAWVAILRCAINYFPPT